MAADAAGEQTRMLKQKITIRLSWSASRNWEQGNSAGLPERGGVYELLVLQQDQTWRRRYVGKGADIKERFETHLLASEPNSCLRAYLRGDYACRFRYALVASADDRADAEQALWDKWHHKCNQVRPAGSARGYDVDLIEE